MTGFHAPPVALSLFSLIAIACLLLTFVMLGSRWVRHYLVAFAVQSWLIALLSALIAAIDGFPELYVIAALTALFRGLLLPYLLLRIVRRMTVERELTPVLQPASSLLLGALAVVFALAVAAHLSISLAQTSRIVVLALTVMLSIKLLGYLMLSVRHEAVSQVLGLLVLENGIFLGTQILVPGMPMLLELVILFDLLIAVVCFGVLVRYLLGEVGSTSSLHLRRLVG